jgi:hypothetical protein
MHVYTCINLIRIHAYTHQLNIRIYIYIYILIHANIHTDLHAFKHAIIYIYIYIYNSVCLAGIYRTLAKNVICFPQDPGALCKSLPPKAEELTGCVTIQFVGPKDLKDRAVKTLVQVNPSRIRSALQWLKHHNPLYKDIIIDETALGTYNTGGECPDVLLRTVTHDSSSDRHIKEQQGYAAYAARHGLTFDAEAPGIAESNFTYTVLEDASGMLITENKEVAEDKRIANGLQSLLKQTLRVDSEADGLERSTEDKVYKFPHNAAPANEHNNPELLMGAFPHLFPYGVGGFEEVLRF